jgi:hypothetical protein
MKTFFLRFFFFSLCLFFAVTTLPAQQNSGLQSAGKLILEIPKIDFGLSLVLLLPLLLAEVPCFHSLLPLIFSGILLSVSAL